MDKFIARYAVKKVDGELVDLGFTRVIPRIKCECEIKRDKENKEKTNVNINVLVIQV